nr:unnamed protein product [Callosobruchus analis]
MCKLWGRPPCKCLCLQVSSQKECPNHC